MPSSAPVRPLFGMKASGVRNQESGDGPCAHPIPGRVPLANPMTISTEARVRVLMAYARGERKVCSMVRVPTVEEEDAKRHHRERERLIATKTALRTGSSDFWRPKE